MRAGGTKGEKNAKSDAKVWEIVAHIRRIKNGSNPDDGIIRVLIADLQDRYNFHWDLDKDQGTYAGSKVWYDGDRRQVSGKKGRNRRGGKNSEPDYQYQRAGDDSRYGARIQDWEDGYRKDGRKRGDPFAPYKEPITIEEYRKKKEEERLEEDKVNPEPDVDEDGTDSEYTSKKALKGLAHQLSDRLGITFAEAMKIAEGARGLSPLEAESYIRDTDIYKERFKGNEMRRKAGLPVLSEAEYLTLEKSYRESLSRIDVPKGFGDSFEDFAEYIAADISAAEFEDRIELAENIQAQWDPDMKKALMNTYGLKKGDLVAFALDPDKAQHAIARRMKNLEIAEDAIEAGFEKDLGKGKKSRRFLNKLSKEAPDADYEEIFAEQAQYGGTYAALTMANTGKKRGFKKQIKSMAGIQKEGQLDEETRRKRLRESILNKMGGSSGGTKSFGAGEFDTGF